MAATNYSSPTRLCDLVMKGGITSGVVYPLTVCELATAYSFKSIGGTSAGAIAAAAAAAAEYDRRQHGATAQGFEKLKKLPEEIGASGRLLKMFQPDAATRELFAIVIAALNPRTTAGKIFGVAGAALARFWIRAIVAGLIATAIVGWAAAPDRGAAGILIAVLAVLAVISLLIISIGVTLYFDITKRLPANAYGLSYGFDPNSNSTDTPLTNWLTHYLDDLAGKQPGERPLTFGDLHSAKAAPNQPADSGPRSINLEMMTTAINLGRPFRLPFRDPDQLFFFTKREFAKLFPARIVDHMIAHPRPGDDEYMLPNGELLHRFPAEQDLPVIVATRMSLSFPLLLAAVPLYAIDFTRKRKEDRIPERVWFSDGGICSNLPIHFFDAALPQWPTFAINLTGVHPDHGDEAEMVWLPASARSGSHLQWTRIEDAAAPLSSFLASIVDTMQNWQDNTQSKVPGYRERLVHVSQRSNEGGLNLDMPSATIKLLAERGGVAGRKLRERYHDNNGAGWREHRWVRFRLAMGLTFPWLNQIVKSYGKSVTPDPLLHEILMPQPGEPRLPYEMSDANQARAEAAMKAVSALAGAIDPEQTGFLDGKVPRPLPELRVKPRI